MIESAVRLLKRVDRTLCGGAASRHTYVSILEREVVGTCQSLLDVGCGASSPIRHFAARLGYSVGVDAFEASLAASQAARIHHAYKRVDVLQIGRSFPSKSFDCVVALDLIEHLQKADGLELIAMMEGIARKKVIVFTPNGFLPQPPYDGNKFQEHLSGWEVAEMEALGFRVVGVNGWKPLRGPRAEPRWWPTPFWHVASFLTRPLTEGRPTHAFQILCVKNVL